MADSLRTTCLASKVAMAAGIPVEHPHTHLNNRPKEDLVLFLRPILAVSRIQDLGMPHQQFVAPTRAIAQMAIFSKGSRCQNLGKSTLDDS